ncbi:MULTISPECIES: hypothetical protein [Herpetosiphon]|uniref:hypothetical protein n=1 Tax=Herpetosiphon TaxID=64 RepID=UPI000D7D005F|nr:MULTISPECIES: hypothetical protein [Herpetosiphon]MBM7845616.1 hypothetical protein [Herpetosiphon giganteus]
MSWIVTIGLTAMQEQQVREAGTVVIATSNVFAAEYQLLALLDSDSPNPGLVICRAVDAHGVATWLLGAALAVQMQTGTLQRCAMAVLDEDLATIVHTQLVPGLQIVTPILPTALTPLLRDLPLLGAPTGSTQHAAATYRALRRSLPLVLDARTVVHRSGWTLDDVLTALHLVSGRLSRVPDALQARLMDVGGIEGFRRLLLAQAEDGGWRKEEQQILLGLANGKTYRALSYDVGRSREVISRMVRSQVAPALAAVL